MGNSARQKAQDNSGERYFQTLMRKASAANCGFRGGVYEYQRDTSGNHNPDFGSAPQGSCPVHWKPSRRFLFPTWQRSIVYPSHVGIYCGADLVFTPGAVQWTLRLPFYGLLGFYF
jgi:hypothetical protein